MSKTVFEAYNGLKEALQKAGIEDFVFEAKQIIKHVTGLTNREILEHYSDTLTPFAESSLQVILRQREIHYPLQYALGNWDCYGLTFMVGPGVLIPRSDTETVIETAIEKIKDIKSPAVLDLCCGTGCIGISIANERKDAAVTLLEKYPEAARYAQENIIRHKTYNATLKIGDVFEGTASDKKYDLIVSNPPYVTKKEMGELQTEVTFEPETALYGGEDGLDFYRAIVKNYSHSLNENGIMMFEIGQNEAVAVTKLLEEEGLKNITVKQDIEHRDRVVFGTAETI